MSEAGEDAAPAAGRDVVEEVARLIDALEAHPDPAVGENVRALLAGIDAVHRTGLGALISAVHGMAGDAFVHRLAGDPAIRFLFMSYDLLAVDRHILAEEALDVVRGALHRDGVDVEVREVVGGVVYVRVHGLEKSPRSPSSVREALESALREGLPGFQELALRDRSAGGASTVVPLGALRRARRPVLTPVLPLAELLPGALHPAEVDGQPLLVANLGGEVVAVVNRCGESPLPLQFGTLDGAELRCSWHGCRYDLRTGRRLDGGTGRLAVFPVAVEGGMVSVALDTTG